MVSERVTQLRLYSIVLNDSRLWGRVKNVEEIFDKRYICIVNISNQISKLCAEGSKMTIYKEELNSGWLQHGNDMKIVWNAESASKAEEPSPKCYACRAPTQPNIKRV